MSLGIDGSLGTASLGLGDVAPRTQYGFFDFAWAPNGQNFVTETLTWLTSIITAQSGKEQRQAMRFKPRRTLSFSLTLDDLTQAQKLESMLYGASHYEYALPVWTDQARTTQATSSGETRLYFDTRYGDFRTNNYVVLWRSNEVFEYTRVVQIEDDNILMPEDTFYDWPAGSIVMPVVFGKFVHPQAINYFTNHIATVDLTFEISPRNTDFGLSNANAPSTYLGLEVFNYSHNWIDGFEVTHDAAYMPIDATVGQIARFYDKRHATSTFPHKWWLQGKPALHAFKQFLQRRKGMLVPFWYVRKIADATLTAPVVVNTRTISLLGSAHTLFVGMGKGRDHIAISLRNGAQVYAQVESLSTLAGNTIITTTADITTGFAPDDVVNIGWMQKCRLAADQVTIPWLTYEFADPETFFTTVID